jgi:hypothetical protein
MPLIAKRRALDETTTLAIATTVEVTNLLRDRTIPEIAEQLRIAMPAITTQFGEVAAIVSADNYNIDRSRANLSSEYVATPKPKEVATATQAAVGFGISQLSKQVPFETFQSTLAGSVQRLVLKGDRDTIEFNIVTDPDGTTYERVPSFNACEFCLVMAAVVEVQRSSSFDKYHNFCRCTLNPIFTGQEKTKLDFYDKIQKSYSQADRTLERQRQENGWYKLKTKEAASKYPELVKNTPNYLRLMRQQNKFEKLTVFGKEKYWFQNTEGSGISKAAILAAQNVPLKNSGITLKTLSAPDTIEDAFKSSNPKFGLPGYSENCARVVQAYELRRRGYDVTANAYDRDLGFLQNIKNYLGGWKNPITGETADQLAVPVKTFLQGQQKILAYGENARGNVFFSYKGRNASAHTLNWEVVNNEVVWLDAQVGNFGQDTIRRYVGRVKDISIVRMDDLEPSAHTTYYLDGVIND